VLIGGIGSGDALRFAVLGSPPIRASLIERAARPGEVLACHETCRRAGEVLELKDFRETSPRNREADEQVHSILGVGGRQLISLRAEPTN
jgi:class 3 adenylate cyclase